MSGVRFSPAPLNFNIMKRNLEDYIYYKKNFLSKSYCEDVIQEISTSIWTKHEWIGLHEPLLSTIEDGANSLNGYGKFDITKPAVSNIVNTITNDLDSVITEYIQSYNFDWFYVSHGHTSIKLFQYLPKQAMQLHCDHVRDIFDGKGVPIFTVLGAFNDDYSGGELIMFGDTKIEIKQGDVILFPSNFLYPHQISPVTKGVRYSYVSWGW